MIVFDTETTGFLNHMDLPLDQQPDIIEFGAVKLNDVSLEEVGALHFLICPRNLPLSKETTKANGITTEMVAKEPKFARRLNAIIDFFLGERHVYALNAPFDLGILLIELRRLDYVTKFPWPPSQTDVTTLAGDIEGATHTGRHKQADLYRILTGREPEGAHRALSDARNLAEILRKLRERDGRI